MAANLPSPNLNFRVFSLGLPRIRPSIKKVPVSPDSPCKSSFSAPSSVIFPSSVNKEAAVNGGCGGGANESRLSLVWKEVQGVNNWENLIQPLDPLLRDEIIRYAEFLSACYKAFDLQPDSKRYLNCKYGKRNLLSEVGLGGSGYGVTKYIYGTPDIKVPIQTLTLCSRWMGYIAVSNDNETKRLGRRDVLITFRGTVTIPEWIANFMSTLAPARFDPHNPRPEVMVETGFLNLYTSKENKSKFGPLSCREQLLSEVSRLIDKYKGEEISITLSGHSMGSSLAVLLAYDIAELGINKVRDDTEIPITVFSFGGPRVGNPGFKKRCEVLGVKVLRIVNTNDPITKLPGVVFNEGFKVFADKYGFPWKYFSCYAHVGVELGLNFFKMHNPSCVHDLEDYISSLHTFPTDTQVASQRDFNNFDFLDKTKQFLYLVRILYLLWTNGAIKMVEFLSLIIYVCIYVYRYS